MSQRATIWSLTINNPTEADEEDIARARQKGWKVDGQLEKGENGTTHYQLILKTPQVRFSAVKKAFPRAHIEVARNPTALEQYVKKDDTRVSALSSSSDKYPSLSKFWMLMYNEIVENNWLNWGEQPFAQWWKEAFDDLEYTRFNYDRNVPIDAQNDFAQVMFEEVVRRLIKEGYHVEHFYSPPNISVFRKFYFAILWRCYIEKSQQTDRQTDALESQEVNIPTIHTNDPEEVVSEEESESSPSSPRSTSPQNHP